MPFVRPVNVKLVAVVVDDHVAPPSDETSYPEIVMGGLTAGAVQLRATCVLPGVAARPVGAPGKLFGVAWPVEEVPAPAAFTALTAMLYDVPLARPVKVYDIG